MKYNRAGQIMHMIITECLFKLVELDTCKTSIDDIVPMTGDFVSVSSTQVLTDIKTRLYVDQQAAKTRRANFEKSILQPAQEVSNFYSPTEIKSLSNNKGKDTKSSKKPNQSSKFTIAREIEKELRKAGVVRLDGCLSKLACHNLRQTALHGLKRVKDSYAQGSSVGLHDILGMEIQRKCRTEFKLSLLQNDVNNNPIVDALQELIGVNGSVREIFEVLVSKK